MRRVAKAGAVTNRNDLPTRETVTRRLPSRCRVWLALGVVRASKSSLVGIEVLPTHTPELFAAAVDRAVDCLRSGGVVGLPTETVYGLAANAMSVEAVGTLFAIKERPAENPVIVHVVGTEMARACAHDWPEAADRLARAFWPGPLTLVVRRAESIPGVVTAGGPTVGVRWPAHPLMQAVIRGCGFPLAAPSANRANTISPTIAAHVVASLGDRLGLVVDGGPSQVGIESTVIDVTVTPPRVLRPGMIHEEALAAVVGAVACGGAEGEGVRRSPGQMPRHYAPRARLVVWEWRDDAELARRLAALDPDPGAVHVVVSHRIPSVSGAGRISVIPHEPEAYARAMYAEWHRCDELGARWIVVESVPDAPGWRAIADRLRRASAA